MILRFFHFYSLVILLVSLFFSCFRYFYVFINFIGDILKIIVKCYWIALEIALYKFIIIIIIYYPILSNHLLYVCHLNIQTSSEHVKRNFIFIGA